MSTLFSFVVALPALSALVVQASVAFVAHFVADLSIRGTIFLIDTNIGSVSRAAGGGL